MTEEEFLKKARALLDKDPKSRITLLAKAVLESPKCIVDIHTHIFDKKTLNVGYILLRMLKTVTLESFGIEAVDEEIEDMQFMTKKEESLYDEIEQQKSDSEQDWEQLEKELELTIELNETYELFGYNLKEALKVLKKANMLEVLDYYHQDFSITNLKDFEDNYLVAGILQMDLETGWGIKPKRDYEQQLKDIRDIAKQRPIIPFMAIDPRRVDSNGSNLYSLFLEAFTDEEAPFFGVKCYPSLGYIPSDARLDPIFNICAEKNIPVLTHCGGESVSTFKKSIRIKTQNGYEEFEIPGESRKERARYLNEPEHWEPVLEKYPDLKLNFGHFGGDDFWLEFHKTGNCKRIEKIYEMMRNPKWKVYADFSFNLVEEELFDKLKTELDAHPDIAKRILFGTDYWVVLPAGELLNSQEKYLKLLSDHQMNMLQNNAIDYLYN